MDMNRIIGALVSGFACKVYAAALAVWMASEVYAALANFASAAASAL